MPSAARLAGGDSIAIATAGKRNAAQPDGYSDKVFRKCPADLSIPAPAIRLPSVKAR
jgi:hypothetical protein